MDDRVAEPVRSTPGTSPQPQGFCVQVGDLVIDLQCERVTRNGRQLVLPQLSFDLLAALVRAAPHRVSVDSLMRQVWTGLDVSPETVSQRVKLLRAALGDNSWQPRYIAGGRGHGYRIVVPVLALPAVAVVGTAAAVQVPIATTAEGGKTVAPASHPPTGQPELEDARRPRTWHQLLLPISFAIFTAVIVSAIWVLSHPAAKPASADASRLSVSAAMTSVASGQATPVSKKVRLAVLPFENLSPDATDAFFTDGMHEEVIIGLAEQLPGVEVIARTTMLTYGGRPPRPVSEIASELGVTHVIEGSVRRRSDEVRLELQLIDARSDAHVWSHTYERSLVNALTLQSEIAADIATQLSMRPPENAAQATPLTRDVHAYDSYLKAKLLPESLTLDQPLEALQERDVILTAAIDRDPQFAAAYADRMVTRLKTFANNFDVSAGQTRRAQQDLEMAERIAPRQPPVLAARGYYAMLIDQDYPAALAAYTAAEEAGLADPIWILPKADALLSLGRRDEAMQTIERALRLDPRNTFLIIYYSELLQGSRRVRDALQTLELGIERVPDAQDLQRQRNYLLFMNTGDQAALDALTSLAGPLPPPDSKSFEDNGARLATLSASLRFNHRLVELQQWLARYPTERLRSRYLAAGEEPIARLRGWADLLVSDRVAAAKAGRAVLAFLQSTPETRLNKAFRRLLAAEAYTFIGDSSGAVAAVREAEQLRPWAHYAPGFGPVFGESVAAVYAWNGAHDQAVALLGNLATEISGPGPGEITRDPIYTMPLADDAGFKALVSKLEAQMRALKIELSHVAASSPNPPESRDDARNFERRRDRPIR